MMEHRARAMRMKMNEKGMWRWALRGIVIQWIQKKKCTPSYINYFFQHEPEPESWILYRPVDW
jgi:hypothetical protein